MWAGSSKAGVNPSPDVLPPARLTASPHGRGTSGAAGGVTPGLGWG